NSQVLFKGTADENKKSEYATSVKEVIVREVTNITNINSGGGQVFQGPINVGGNFIGGNQSNITNDSREPSASPSDSVLRPSGTLDPNVKIELTMLMGSLMQAVQPVHFNAVVNTKNKLEKAFTNLKDGEKADVGHILTDLTDITAAASPPIRTAFEKPMLANLISASTKTTVEQLLP
ncbi:MAG: hypothetical protein AAGD96_13295, partial [Chloroflexota bacterium]